jgi:kynurenine 3-monooxygenase
MEQHQSNNPRIAIVGGGPAGLVLAIALARRGIATKIFERDIHPEVAPRFNPDRSYTIDISGHGLKALRHIEACEEFDQRMIPFKGLVTPQGEKLPWDLPGWTVSRGDILRSLTAVAESRYAHLIDLRYESNCLGADLDKGKLTIQSGTGTRTSDRFDLIVASDGAGSVIRGTMVDAVPGFGIAHKSLPNYCTMIELDRVDGRLDRRYLYGLSVAPFCVAGAIMGDEGPESSRWFCAIGTKREMRFASADEARRFLARKAPRVLDYASPAMIEAYSARPCYHIGQKLTCTQLNGKKGVLIGDAAGPFPPIGQGVNAAMESAMTLDLAIAKSGGNGEALLRAAQIYSESWKPEIDAVSWMSEKSLFENRFHMLRVQLAMKLGANMFEDAKRDDIAWSEVKRQAQKRRLLWA